MSTTQKTDLLPRVQRSFFTPRTNNRLADHYGLIAAAVFLIMASCSPDPGLKDVIPKNQNRLKNVIPKDQKPVLKVFPPSTAEQSQSDAGKFIIFTREHVGKDWDFIAGAWECIPSLPKIPITKRVEFCHSSWNCVPLLGPLVADHSEGMHPRFVELQVDSDDRNYYVNLYDINYRTWDVRCIWQGSRLSAFGVMGDSIFCRSTDRWLLVNAASGHLSDDIPFTPLATDDGFWLVRKPGEVEGCWSYDRKKRRYIAHFGPVDLPAVGFSQSNLSPDGKNRAWVLASMPYGWQSGTIAGRLILQRDGEKEDVSVPIKMQAFAGSGVAVIPNDIQLTFSPEGKFRFRAWMGNKVAKNRVWIIDVATGKVTSEVSPHSKKPANDAWAALDGIPVPDYLRKDVADLGHFGRSGLAPAFLLHLGILKQRPEYADCIAGVSRDGRHVLYKANEGPLAGVFIYGDLLTKQTVRWKSPGELKRCNAMEFIWVETPPAVEPIAAPDRREGN